MKKWIAAIVLMLAVFSSCSGEDADTITYAVYPYLPDAGYYQELIESRWAEIEPGIRLVRKEWDCYKDGAPEGIDVVMYDAIMQNLLIQAGIIQPIDRASVQDIEDIFPFALEGFTVDGRLYGIPVFLCGDFLIYDRNSSVLAEAEHLTDLAGESAVLVIPTKDTWYRAQYFLEALADIRDESNPSFFDYVKAEEIMLLMDQLAIDDYEGDEYDQVALAYDSGWGWGYIGYSETMNTLSSRFPQTAIKAISFSDREDVPLLYADAVAVSGNVDGEKLEKCVELMNVMADAGLLSKLSVKKGNPQFLLLARKSLYTVLSERFPLYIQLEQLAANEENRVILTR